MLFPGFLACHTGRRHKFLPSPVHRPILYCPSIPHADKNSISMAHIQIFEELFGNLHGEYEAQSQGTLLIPPPAVLHYPSSFWQNVGRRSEFRSFVGRPRWTASPTSRAPRASNAHSHSALEQGPKTRWLERLCIHLICDFQDSNSMQ